MTDEEVIPQGKIKTMNGNIIDRADACFALMKHPKSDKLFFDHSGKCYVKDEKGTLRRYPPKKKNRK